MAPNFQHFWILGERYGYFFTAFVFFSYNPPHPPPPPCAATLKANLGATTSSRALSCAPVWELGGGGVRWEV